MNNLHSFLLLLVPVVLLAVPRSWWTSAGTAVLVVAVVLSDTQALLFAPLLLAGIRDRRKWPVVGAFLAAGAAQVATVVAFPRPAISYGASGPVTIADVVVGFVSIPLTTVWTTRLDAVSTLIADAGTAPIVALTVVSVAVAVAAIVSGQAVHRWLVSATVLGAAALWAAALLVTPAQAGSSSRGASPTTSRTSARSGTPPSARACLFLALVVTADAIWGRHRLRRRRNRSRRRRGPDARGAPPRHRPRGAVRRAGHQLAGPRCPRGVRDRGPPDRGTAAGAGPVTVGGDAAVHVPRAALTAAGAGPPARSVGRS